MIFTISKLLAWVLHSRLPEATQLCGSLSTYKTNGKAPNRQKLRPRSAARWGIDGRADALEKTALRRRACAGECHPVVGLSVGSAAHLGVEFRQGRPQKIVALKGRMRSHCFERLNT